MLAEDNDTYEAGESNEVPRTPVPPFELPPKAPENILLCGWRRDFDDMITELDKWVPLGSHLTLLNDIMDPDDYPTASERFHRKHEEMLAFRAAVEAFHRDPELNPVIVMEAHRVSKYGIPPPETQDIRVWQRWYREILDKYVILRHQCEDIAGGNFHEEETS